MTPIIFSQVGLWFTGVVVSATGLGYSEILYKADKISEGQRDLNRGLFMIDMIGAGASIYSEVGGIGVSGITRALNYSAAFQDVTTTIRGNESIMSEYIVSKKNKLNTLKCH